MQLVGVHHVAIVAHDREKLTHFYRDVLGMRQHPAKGNWFETGHGFSLHLMPSDGQQAPDGPSRHVAFQVASLDECAAYLLDKGLKPYQLASAQRRHEVTSTDDPLTEGIGTLFLDDPEGNTLEFVERERGIFAEYDDGY